MNISVINCIFEFLKKNLSWYIALENAVSAPNVKIATFLALDASSKYFVSKMLYLAFCDHQYFLHHLISLPTAEISNIHPSSSFVSFGCITSTILEFNCYENSHHNVHYCPDQWTRSHFTIFLLGLPLWPIFGILKVNLRKCTPLKNFCRPEISSRPVHL